MSAIPLQEEDFVYPTSSSNETGPLRLLALDTFATSAVLSLSLVDGKKQGGFFAVSYAWDPAVCKPCFGVNGDVSCATHGTAPWTNNKALCNNYLSNHRSEPDGFKDILIDGKKFYVQDTVYRLLLTFQRHLREGDYFWLDAICINQNDKFEREQQTRNMHEIYKAAQHVYVWLGTAYDGSDAAMDFLDLLPEITRSTEKGPDEYRRKVVHNRFQPVQSHLKDLSREIYYLFDRPYWKRTWVIQEFLLAQDTTLLCGDRAIPCTKAEYLVNRLDNDVEFRKQHPLWNIAPGVKIIQARKAFISFPVKPALEDMIQHFLFSQSTYPEDKLIGLLRVSLSNAGTDFNGTPGSTEKRVDVINEVVRDIQSREMDFQTAREWKHLLACLLGVRYEFPKPRRPLLEHDLGTSRFARFLEPTQAPRRPYAASGFTMSAAPLQAPRRPFAASGFTMSVVGSVRLYHPSQSNHGTIESP